jgi:hypothetical protein
VPLKKELLCTLGGCDKEISTAKGGMSLAQFACRNQAALHCSIINENDVDITLDAPMLKPIIEEDDRITKLLLGLKLAKESRTITCNANGPTLKVCIEECRFIPNQSWIGGRAFGGEHQILGTQPTISPRQYQHRRALLEVPH